MQRTKLIQLQISTSQMTHARTLLTGSTYGVSGVDYDRFRVKSGLSERGPKKYDVLRRLGMPNVVPPLVRSLLTGSTYGLTAYSEGRFAFTSALQQTELIRRGAILWAPPRVAVR